MVKSLFSLTFALLIISGSLIAQKITPQKLPGSENLIASDDQGKEIEIVWFSPISKPGELGKYERLELGFKLPDEHTSNINNFINSGAGTLNPFDPEKVDVRIVLTSPTGQKITRFAFYYEEYKELLYGAPGTDTPHKNEFVKDTTSYPWRFRFAPNETGSWTASLEVRIEGGKPIIVNGIEFNCIPSDHKGVLKVSQSGTEQDRWMYFSETNEPFFAISNNVSSGGACSYLPSQNHRQLNGVQQLIDAGGNFTRFELGGQSALPDWPNYSNYSGKLDEMYAFDRILTLCEMNDVYFTMFRHHVEVWDGFEWEDVKWKNNPYRIGFNLSPEGYFIDSTVIAWQNKTLRYIFSRWGYSPNMTFYSYSEIDRWYSKLQADDTDGADFKDGGEMNEKDAVNVVKKWVLEQQNFIKQQLNPDMLFTHSHATPTDLELNEKGGFFEISDAISLHNYGHAKNINFKKRETQIDKYWVRYKRPIIMEEMGVGGDKLAMYCCTGIEYHNSLWSTTMMGDFGTGMDWWWDLGVHDFGYYLDLKFVHSFFANEDLRAGNYSPQKWMDKKSIPKSKLENYALVSENKERVLGWIHNSTFYWRNIEKYNPCLQNLINGNVAANDPCHVGNDPHAYPLKENEYACLPRQYNDVYSHENTKGYDSHSDAYTNSGGGVEINDTISIYNNPTFMISGLKSTAFGKLSLRNHWYKIEFFSTTSSTFFGVPLTEFTQIHTTNSSGKLKPHVPPLILNSADYAYKITYLGHSKTPSETIIRPPR